jgi:hypothetical protein
MRCPFPVRAVRGVLYSPRVRDTYLDTWAIKLFRIVPPTRQPIAGLRSSSRVKSITSALSAR